MGGVCGGEVHYFNMISVYSIGRHSDILANNFIYILIPHHLKLFLLWYVVTVNFHLNVLIFIGRSMSSKFSIVEFFHKIELFGQISINELK